MNVMSVAAVGVTNAVQRLDRSAVQMAESNANDLAGVARAVVAQKQAEVAVAANVAVMKSAKETTGQLLDLFV